MEVSENNFVEESVENREEDFSEEKIGIKEEQDEIRGKIVEFEKSEPENLQIPSPEDLAAIQKEHEEKGRKFKLANIKGLKSVQSLFDDDILESLSQTELHDTEEKEHPTNHGSMMKSNMPTDFMEAEKARPEFRLDLNDKLTFSKTLFGGSQADLNDAIRNLNSFKTLEEAKEYLSDMYYDKNWKKVDEYAQRLWTLVENKFL